MNLPNGERVLVSLIREIAGEEGYALVSFSHNWILRLEKEERARHVFGYNFEINSATARMITSDKAATSDLLRNAEIANVDHKLFLHPKLADYVSSTGNWSSMQAYVEKKGYPIIVKPNEGTGGVGLEKVDNPLELEQAVSTLFKGRRAISLSPFHEIEEEYRVIVLDDEVLLIYSKVRPHITGNGQASVLELISNLHQEEVISQKQFGQIIKRYPGDLQHKLPKGQKTNVSWRHNLGAGAQPEIVEDETLSAKLSELAEQARSAVNIRFASIDIVQVDGELKVLEINSGVMLEYFTRHFPDQREKAKSIYAQAIKAMFESPSPS
jgi:glutathione synthase/RimK-type ligase-like ATP-grasp enzyme